MLSDSCDAVAIKVQDGRWLVLLRDNGSLFVVTRIILDALLWGISLTLIPGFAGWYLLRRRPLKRIRAVQASAEAPAPFTTTLISSSLRPSASSSSRPCASG